jgi:ribonuclease HI
MFKPLSPIPDSAKVRFLMNDAGTEWEADTVRAFFHEELADTILQVPISRHGGEDFASWQHDKSGMYTVKSAYNLAKTSEFFSRQESAGRGSCSDREAEAKLWKKVWKIQAPNKMKIVLWRMIHDCLPTGQQLTHRRIPADDRCFFCGKLERVEHLFLLCPFARDVWKTVKEQFFLKLHRKDLINLKQWIHAYLQRENDTNATILAVTCWHVWEARNDTRNGATQLHPVSVASKVLAYVDMIQKFMVKPKGSGRSESAAVAPRWTPPPRDWVCVNVDAALFQAEQRMGWGAVLRDHDGNFLLSCSEGLAGFPPPEMAEAIAVRRALTVSKERGFTKIVLVSDCLSLIQRISSTARDRSFLGTVIGDIKALKTDFQSCLFRFSSRKTNVVAHKLARSSEPLVCKISVAVIPELIREELCNDFV